MVSLRRLLDINDSSIPIVRGDQSDPTISLLQNSQNKTRSSFRASEALHRMVYRAKSDPESRIFKQFSPPKADAFRNDGVSDFCKNLTI